MDRERERRAARSYGIGVSIVGLLFSIFWCVMAASIGAGFMLIFGIPIVGLMAYRLVMSVKLSKERSRERDPWEQPQQHPSYTQPTAREEQRPQGGFCPYCGGEVKEKYTFCPGCGRRL